jgi:cytochrome b561
MTAPAAPTSRVQQYPWFSRLLHWVMAAMVLTMLGIGFAMVASIGDYHRLLSLHRPLGICIFLFVIVRFINRQLHPPPPFPPTMSAGERRIATASERLLYTLMFAMPLVGWGMLSAAGYPIALVGPIWLPPILPHNVMLYAVLRKTHTVLAYLLFVTFLAHFSAVLFHTFILRDRLFDRMAPWKT